MGKEVMDYRYRDYFIFETGHYDYVIGTEELLIALFNCKFHPPYNHFKYGQYDGLYTDKNVTHIISVPKNRTHELISFLSKRNSIGILHDKI